MAEDDARARAENALAPRFTSAMNAATSRYGVLCDIPLTFAVLAALGTVFAILLRFFPGVPTWVVGFVLALPLVSCVGAHIALRKAREGVVHWLASVPFTIENANAVLSGAGEFFELHFVSRVPSREVLMEAFEKVSEDVFVLEQEPDRGVISARFGVMDSKHNPYAAAHVRFERMRQVVAGALVPLHAQYPIERMLVV